MSIMPLTTLPDMYSLILGLHVSLISWVNKQTVVRFEHLPPIKQVFGKLKLKLNMLKNKYF